MNSLRTFILLVVCTLSFGVGGCSSQATFESPQNAFDALFDATRTRDRQAMREIFGERASELMSGDPEVDEADFQRFAAAMERYAELTPEKDGQVTLLVGEDLVPFAAPLVKEEGKWRYDTDAGVEEMINRRIGRNELRTIQTCRLYARAQFEYYVLDPDNDGIRCYAQVIRSTPGKRDGLYWPDMDGNANELTSPLGPLMAEAAAGGDVDFSKRARQPYHGYFYKILTRQGASAAGGAKNFIDDKGRMSHGHALIAWPAVYDETGIMSFLVDKDGTVYEMDLGDDSEAQALKTVEFNPADWKKVAN